MILGLMLSSVAVAVSSEQTVRVLAPRFDFGTIVQGEVVSHRFALKNDGLTALRIQGVSATAPLLPGRVPVHMGPGAEVAIPVELDTAKLNGSFEGDIVITLNDPSVGEVRLTVTGRVVPPVEVTPRPALFAATQRGEPRQVFVDIINHEADPLVIEALEHSTERFTTRLETVEAGRRYRLHLNLNPSGPAGKHKENIRIRMAGKRHAALTIPAYTNLRERVYTFPDAVDLGRLRLADVEARPDMLTQTAQTLMVYRPGQSDFEVKMRTDLPEIHLQWERGPHGDRYQARVMLLKDKLRPGPITGSIVIQTNDPEFPTLTVPVSGAILPRSSHERR
jgi:hypothetical protein